MIKNVFLIMSLFSSTCFAQYTGGVSGGAIITPIWYAPDNVDYVTISSQTKISDGINSITIDPSLACSAGEFITTSAGWMVCATPAGGSAGSGNVWTTLGGTAKHLAMFDVGTSTIADSGLDATTILTSTYTNIAKTDAQNTFSISDAGGVTQTFINPNTGQGSSSSLTIQTDTGYSIFKALATNSPDYPKWSEWEANGPLRIGTNNGSNGDIKFFTNDYFFTTTPRLVLASGGAITMLSSTTVSLVNDMQPAFEGLNSTTTQISMLNTFHNGYYSKVGVAGASVGNSGGPSDYRSGVGVYGAAVSVGGTAEAFVGIATGTGTNYGFKSLAYGSGSSYGSYAQATGTGTNYGIYATASGGSTNYAGYFAGDAVVSGTLDIGLTVVSSSCYQPALGVTFTCTASCPTGKTAISGSYYAAPSPPYYFYRSGNSWIGSFLSSGAATQVVIDAICARVK